MKQVPAIQDSQEKSLNVFSTDLPAQWVGETNLQALKNEDEKQTKLAVLALIEQQSQLFGSQEDFPNEAKMELARYIVAEMTHLTLQDVMLFFKKATTGQFGKLFGKINFLKLTEWLAVYDNEWHEHNDSRHKQRKDEENDEEIHPDAKKHVRELLEKLNYEPERDEKAFKDFKINYLRNKARNDSDTDIQNPEEQVDQ